VWSMLEVLYHNPISYIHLILIILLNLILIKSILTSSSSIAYCAAIHFQHQAALVRQLFGWYVERRNNEIWHPPYVFNLLEENSPRETHWHTSSSEKAVRMPVGLDVSPNFQLTPIFRHSFCGLVNRPIQHHKKPNLASENGCPHPLPSGSIFDSQGKLAFSVPCRWRWWAIVRRNNLRVVSWWSSANYLGQREGGRGR